MIFQNNAMDFQILPYNKYVHCPHFKALESKYFKYSTLETEHTM